MSAVIGGNLNRVISATITAADIAAGLAWVALNIDTSGGSTVLIDGIDFHINVTGADYNNILFVQVIIIKNVNLNPSLPVASQLGAGAEQYFNGVSGFVPERSYQRQFTQPYVLEANSRYAVLGQGFFSVFAGPTVYELNVLGRTINAGGRAEFPYELR